MQEEQLWYVTVDGETTVGPVTLDQLKRGVAAGKIPNTAKVNKIGSSEWIDVLDVLKPAAPPSLPPAPPAPPASPVGAGASTKRWLLPLAGITGAVVIAGVAVGAALLSRSEPSPAASAPAASAPPRAAQLPAPFGNLRVGMSVDEVRMAFPPAEPWESCTPAVVGSEPAGVDVPEQRKNEPHSSCPGAGSKAGVTTAEMLAGMQLGSDSDSPNVRALKSLGFWTAARQVRAVVRAGGITASEVAAVHRGRGGKAEPSPVATVAAELLDGSMKFVRPKPARRPICATVKEDCTGLDVDRVRRYLAGEFSLGDLDSAARTRVANGRCLGQYVAREREFQLEFVSVTGGLAGIGLARSSLPSKTLDPARPETFAVFRARSGLDADIAAFGVRVANGLEATKGYFAGAVELHAGKSASTVLVWLRNGAVSRILMNIDGASPDLREQLSSLYGGPPESAGMEQVWKLDGGSTTARLDVVVAMSLVLEAAADEDPDAELKRLMRRSGDAPGGDPPTQPRDPSALAARQAAKERCQAIRSAFLMTCFLNCKEKHQDRKDGPEKDRLIESCKIDECHGAPNPPGCGSE